MSEKNRVVIWVDGGNVQGVYCDNHLDLEVVMVDFDNLEAEGFTAKQRDEKLIKARRNTKEIY